MAENKKTTKKAAPKKSTAGTGAVKKSASTASKPKAKAAKSTVKPKTEPAEITPPVESIAELQEVIDTIDAIFKKVDEHVPDQVTITVDTVTPKGWLKKLLKKFSIGKAKTK